MAIFTCGARTKSCRQCGHRYAKAEYGLWECPECGEGRACRARVGREGERCRLHGGRSLAGVASPSFKHGRYSKYLPGRLVGRYEEARADPELLALRDEIALVDVRLAELLQRLETGESPGGWAQLRGVYSNLVRAQGNNDVQGITTALQKFESIIEGGGQEDAAWGETIALLDQRRKLVESERKRLVEMQQMITTEQALALLARIQQVILDNVDDRRVITAISAEFKRIAVVESGRGA